MITRRAALGLLAAAGALSGCATLPTSGAVVSEPRRSQASDPGGAAIDPDPPTAGASPSLIIDGFLHAMATYQPGYPAARQYLTSAAKTAWRPEAGVLVYADGTAPTVTADKVTMEVPLVGTLGTDGAFDAAGEGMWSHDFGLVKENGEWRISHPQEGILISRYLFASGFVRHDVFFLDGTKTTLVPDARYVARGNRTPSAVLRLLLAGPSRWLAPSVVTAVPAGTSIVGSVGDSGEVTLPFSAVPTNPADRSLMCAQVAELLRQLPDVTGFRLTAQGAAVDIPEQRPDGSIPLSMADRYDPIVTLTSQLFAMSDGHLVRAPDTFGGTARVVNGDFGSQSWEASAIAVAPDGMDAALLVGNQLVRGTVDGQGTKSILTREGMLRPQFSRDGGLWTMTTSGEVWRADGDHAARVQAPALQGRSVVAFRISPDGQRIAVVAQNNGSREVGLVRIERGTSFVVDGWRTVPLFQDSGPVAGAIDVGWSSTTSLTVLAGVGRPGNVFDVDIDGVVLHDDGRSDLWSASSLAVSPRGSRKVVGDATDAAVYLYQDSFRWFRLAGKLSAPSYPG
ncbi:MAG TPA: LpqB family beta-propeller domain-containing protein [Propionibacteriaceae bacterium]|nr:LpqB family beta-propeller domain-containing protein [Propionibacteriaceae bacterium]